MSSRSYYNLIRYALSRHSGSLCLPITVLIEQLNSYCHPYIYNECIPSWTVRTFRAVLFTYIFFTTSKDNRYPLKSVSTNKRKRKQVWTTKKKKKKIRGRSKLKAFNLIILQYVFCTFSRRNFPINLIRSLF